MCWPSARFHDQQESKDLLGLLANYIHKTGALALRRRPCCCLTAMAAYSNHIALHKDAGGKIRRRPDHAGDDSGGLYEVRKP